MKVTTPSGVPVFACSFHACAGPLGIGAFESKFWPLLLTPR